MSGISTKLLQAAGGGVVRWLDRTLGGTGRDRGWAVAYRTRPTTIIVVGQTGLRTAAGGNDFLNR